MNLNVVRPESIYLCSNLSIGQLIVAIPEQLLNIALSVGMPLVERERAKILSMTITTKGLTVGSVGGIIAMPDHKPIPEAELCKMREQSRAAKEKHSHLHRDRDFVRWVYDYGALTLMDMPRLLDEIVGLREGLQNARLPDTAHQHECAKAKHDKALKVCQKLSNWEGDINERDSIRRAARKLVDK